MVIASDITNKVSIIMSCDLLLVLAHIGVDLLAVASFKLQLRKQERQQERRVDLIEGRWVR